MQQQISIRMKYLMIALLIVLAGCKKEDLPPPITYADYTVIAHNASDDAAILKVDEEHYQFGKGDYKKQIRLEQYDVVNLSLDYVQSGTADLTLSVYKDNNLVISVSGNSYMWIVLSRNNPTKGGGNYTPPSGGSGGSGSSYCGAPTKDGTPCKRKVSGGGYCWQHD